MEFEQTKVGKTLRREIDKIEADIQRDIDDEENPVIKLHKMMMRDAAEIWSQIGLYEAKYGIVLTMEIQQQDNKDEI